jgi:hypothetical protein
VKSLGSTQELLKILHDLSMGEDSGIFGVEVKFLDIRENVSGESDYLKHY